MKRIRDYAQASQMPVVFTMTIHDFCRQGNPSRKASWTGDLFLKKKQLFSIGCGWDWWIW